MGEIRAQIEGCAIEIIENFQCISGPASGISMRC